MIKFIKNVVTLNVFITLIFCESLWDAYFDASPGEGYDKHMILEQNVIYTGGLGLYQGSLLIDGNGAVIDLQDGLGIWVTAEENQEVILDIKYTTIINGHDMVFIMLALRKDLLETVIL